jgi:hypothetical protein
LQRSDPYDPFLNYAQNQLKPFDFEGFFARKIRSPMYTRLPSLLAGFCQLGASSVLYFFNSEFAQNQLVSIDFEEGRKLNILPMQKTFPNQLFLHRSEIGGISGYAQNQLVGIF